MAEFNFEVDTSPMARSIDKINGSVQVVGTAVTAMQAAVIASERRAANKICESVDSGFFMLLRSRLSQRIAGFASIMNSRVGSMTETASAIDNTHRQMQGDFNRIKARYLKLFDRLDRNLEQRVRELDRPAMEVAQRRELCLTERQRGTVPAVVCYANDIANVSLKLSNARSKVRAQGSINELHAGVEKVLEYEQATESIYERGGAPRGAQEMIPVVYTVTESTVEPNSFALQVQPPTSLAPETQSAIAMGVRRGQAQLRGASASEVNAIRASFFDRVSRDVSDQRVAQTMIGLFNTAPFANDATGGAR